MDDLMFGVAMANATRAQSALDAALTLRDAVDDRNSRIRELQSELKAMHMRAAKAEAIAAGRKAQVDTLLAGNACAEWKMPTAQRFHDGQPKTRIRLIYEKAFDAAIARWGISDPTAYRDN